MWFLYPGYAHGRLLSFSVTILILQNGKFAKRLVETCVVARVTKELSQLPLMLLNGYVKPKAHNS